MAMDTCSRSEYVWHTPRSATTKGFNSAHKAVNIQLYHSVSDVLYNSSFLYIRDAFHMLVCMDPLLHDTRYVVPEAQPQTIGYSSAFTSCTVLVTSTITFFLTRSSIMSSMAARLPIEALKYTSLLRHHTQFIRTCHAMDSNRWKEQCPYGLFIFVQVPSTLVPLVLRIPGMLLWLLVALSARTMDHITWMRLRMMVDWKRAHVFDERRRFTVFGILESMHAAAIWQSWMRDIFDDRNKERNDTSPVASILVTRTLFTLQSCFFHYIYFDKDTLTYAILLLFYG
ncbi:predicted protein [Lichtheimia corymbifera JMRC:FSU:9682]|uniref:Uncharacterized protein n=1 Tax=Lichtheimia corymbifera JMRC:FSU:9682 TaxID=1263082 RepID=A0A068S104_9FUNG|nr:predicted protein [Lichtheimia corymbifera JMRC:FSU:9682]